MSVHTHFDGAVRYLVWIVMTFSPRGRIYYPETIMEAYDAIGYIGEYMGRSDIIALTEPAHVILGDTPALDDITWVLAEVQKFRELNAHVVWWAKLFRWFRWVTSNKNYQFHYPER